MLLWILGALLCIVCDLFFAFLLHILMRSNVLTAARDALTLQPH